MPKTKFQSVVFTLITAWIMVYIMTLYNTVLASGSFTNYTFWVALKGMWIEYVIIFLCAFFISSSVAKYFAFRVVKPGDRPIFIIFAIQIFTVVCQVALASILGVYHGYGFTAQFVPNYLTTYCKNFVMALPVQLFIAGPLARWLFRLIFVRKNKNEEDRTKPTENVADINSDTETMAVNCDTEKVDSDSDKVVTDKPDSESLAKAECNLDADKPDSDKE